MKALKWTRLRSLLLVALLVALSLASVLGLVTDSQAAGPPMTESPPPDRFERRARWLHKQRAFPMEDVPDGARMRALEQIKKSKVDDTLGPSGGAGFKWFSLGPAPIQVGGGNSGRVSAVAVDPVNTDHWLIGAAQGGLWETWDSGLHWEARTDDQASLAIGAISFAPGDPKVIYAGTGEANFSRDSYAGAGLLKSMDRGSNWFLLASSQFSRGAFSDIQVNPSNRNMLMAGTARGILGKVASNTNLPPLAPQRGILKSTSGGTNWTLKLGGECTDLEMDPADFNRQYAALGETYGHVTNGVYRSTNAGESWTKVNGPWTADIALTNVGRVELAISSSDADTLYVAVARPRGASPSLLGIWRTDNAWALTPTWTQLANPPSGSGSSQGLGSSIWYYFELIVDPANPGVLYLGGKDLMQHSVGGWTIVSGPLHNDQHAFAWAGSNPSGSRLLVGNDGGVWVSGYGVGSWNNRNDGLAITQFYGGSVHPTDSDLALGGSQDNGTDLYTGSFTWNRVYGGDGGFSAISSTHPDTHWAFSYQPDFFVHILRTKDAGANINDVSSTINPAYAPFVALFEKHPSLDDLFVAATVSPWKCANFFSTTTPTWSSNGPVLLMATGEPAEITALAFAPSDALGNTYAYGTEDGQLRITSNGGTNWADLDPANAVPGRYITDLAFHPINSNTLYVTLSGFDEGTPSAPGHIFRTTNALAGVPVWTNVSPPVNLPVNAIAVNPAFGSQVFVGTDIGLWRSQNDGGSWSHEGPASGMPNVAVFDVRMNSFGTPTAFTHGRGAFVFRFDPGDLPDYVWTRCILMPCEDVFLNPGDLVTIDFPLQAIIHSESVNLVARLQPSALITPKSGPQIYGALQAGGPSVTKSFSFIAGESVGGGGAAAGSKCGDVVEAILELQDQGRDVGTVAFPFRLGRRSTPLSEDLEGSRPPALPVNWRTAPPGTTTPWVTTTNAPRNFIPGGAPEEDVSDPPGTNVTRNVSMFAPVPALRSDNMLYSPLIPLTGTSTRLSFRHSFDIAPDAGGGVLEISIDDGPFEDLEQARGTFADNGYNATMGDLTPLAGRRAWTGNSRGYLVTHVNLPVPPAGGQTIQLRWRCVTDAIPGVPGGDGWFVDNVIVQDVRCLNPVSNPVIVRPRLLDGRFAFAFATVSKRTYIVECKASLEEPAWQILETVDGDGAEHTSITPLSSDGRQFYRFRVE